MAAGSAQSSPSAVILKEWPSQEERQLWFGRSKPQHEFESLPFRGDSGKIVAIKVHNLVPRRREVLHKRFLRIVRRIDLRDCPELGVRTEEKIDARAGPLDLARLAVAPLIHAL